MLHHSIEQVYEEIMSQKLLSPRDLQNKFREYGCKMLEKPFVNYTLHLSTILGLLKDNSVFSLLPECESISSELIDLLDANERLIESLTLNEHTLTEIQNISNESQVILTWLFECRFGFSTSHEELLVFWMQCSGKVGEIAAKILSQQVNKELEHDAFHFIEDNYSKMTKGKVGEEMVTNIQFLSYCEKNRTIRIEYEEEFRSWPQLENKQCKHCILVLLARQYQNTADDDCLMEILQLLPDVYISTIESISEIIEPTEHLYNMLLGIQEYPLSVEEFLLYCFSFSKFAFHDEQELLSAISSAIFPSKTKGEEYFDALFFFIYELAQNDKVDIETYVAIEELLLPFIFFNSNENLRLIASTCYEQIYGYREVGDASLCEELLFDEMHQMEYSISLYSQKYVANLRAFNEQVFSWLAIEQKNEAAISSALGLNGEEEVALSGARDIETLTAECYFYARIISKEQLEILINGKYDFDNLEEQFDFFEAIAFLLNTQFDCLKDDQDFELFCQKYLNEKLPFILRYYFNDASLKQIRTDIELESLKLGALCCGEKNFSQECINEYLKTISIIEGQRVEEAIEFLNSITGPELIFLKIVFLNTVSCRFEHLDGQFIIECIHHFIQDYSNDFRGDIGSEVRYRAYELLVKYAHKNDDENDYFLVESIYFLCSRNHSLRYLATKSIVELSEKHNNLTRIFDYLPHEKEEGSTLTDLTELTSKQMERESKQDLKKLDNRHMELCVSLFKEQFPEECIAALLYIIFSTQEDEMRALWYLDKEFTDEQVADVLIKALENPQGFNYHMILSAQIYLHHKQVFSEQMTRLLFEFAKSPQVPIDRLKECIITIELAAEAHVSGALEYLFMFLGHKNGFIREYAANQIVNYLLKQNYEYEQVRLFCNVTWATLKIEEIEKIRLSISQALNIKLL